MTSAGDPPGALARYFALAERYPQLFAGRERRRIVCDRAAIEQFAREHGTPMGVIAETPYYYVLSDLVETAVDGQIARFAYSRIVRKAALHGAAGAAAFATMCVPASGATAVVMLRQERHATGRVEWEIPRGFGEPGEAVEDVAARELAEETGYAGTVVRRLGEIAVDSGLDDGVIGLVHIAATHRVAARREREEAIVAVELVPLDELRAAVANGAVRDSFTLAALCLYLATTPSGS